jgi:hypothetical protein
MQANEAVAQATGVKPTVPSVEWPVRLPENKEFASLDADLQQWKLARKHNFEIPWRSLSLMAALCFGIASFVLPDSVNDDLQWLLYALVAASLYFGFFRHRRQAKT